MVSRVQNNSLSPNTKVSQLNIGVLNPPDNFQKVVLYSDAEASQQFKQLNRDVCTLQKKVAFEETKKTPKSVFWIVGSACAVALGFLIKKLIRH